MIRDVKSPVGLPANIWLLLLILAVIIIALGTAAFIYFHKKKGKSEEEQEVIVKSPWEIACEQLKLLSESGLLSRGEFDEYFIRLSDIVRRYFEGQFNIKAPEMTTEEFLNYLRKASELGLTQKGQLEEFLTSCDMVKFAKYTPDVTEAQKCFDSARELINSRKPQQAG